MVQFCSLSGGGGGGGHANETTLLCLETYTYLGTVLYILFMLTTLNYLSAKEDIWDIPGPSENLLAELAEKGTNQLTMYCNTAKSMQSTRKGSLFEKAEIYSQYAKPSTSVYDKVSKMVYS